MSCAGVLDELVRDFERCAGGHDGWCRGYRRVVENQDAARLARRSFIRDYPLRGNPRAIEALTSKQVYNPGGDSFFLWIGWRLRWLGAINAPGLPLAFEAAAGTYLKEFKNLLMTALDDGRRPASKIDAAWEQIPGFGGDKQIAKKIVATYYPDEILPIFATKRMECHAQKRFGTDVNGVCRKRYGMSYADVGMTAGKRWELLSEALLDRKDHHPRTGGEDHVFFMYVLEHRGCS